MLCAFRQFLLRTNALAPAVGVIIGAGADFADIRTILREATGGDPATEVAIRWGELLNAAIAFVVVALIVWRISTLFIGE